MTCLYRFYENLGVLKCYTFVQALLVVSSFDSVISRPTPLRKHRARRSSLQLAVRNAPKEDAEYPQFDATQAQVTSPACTVLILLLINVAATLAWKESLLKIWHWT